MYYTCVRTYVYTIDNPPKSLILKAGYSSMATLVFEYNVVPYIPLLAPVKQIPQLQSE
jgi:abhydrolase domain-containing protein 12